MCKITPFQLRKHVFVTKRHREIRIRYRKWRVTARFCVFWRKRAETLLRNRPKTRQMQNFAHFDRIFGDVSARFLKNMPQIAVARHFCCQIQILWCFLAQKTYLIGSNRAVLRILWPVFESAYFSKCAQESQESLLTGDATPQ